MAMLYFGCRDQNSDFIFKDTIEKAKKDGLVKVDVAFSRPQGEN